MKNHVNSGCHIRAAKGMAYSKQRQQQTGGRDISRVEAWIWTGEGSRVLPAAEGEWACAQ
eukprot:360874-Chlamydomonas_euryale.AAC.24